MTKSPTGRIANSQPNMQRISCADDLSAKLRSSFYAAYPVVSTDFTSVEERIRRFEHDSQKEQKGSG